MTILSNRIRTPDGTLLESFSRHDYKTYKDANGHVYMVDGGRDYLRRNKVDEAPYEEISVYLTDDHEENRKYFSWGTRGPDGKNPLTYKRLYELDTDHIEAILETQYHISQYIKDLMTKELEYRNELLSGT